mmetsp:Transcript_33850/g.66816  ORF Transcript_33850/g.66816 Transcript_33850/m.66816 type:complete len:193 (+) Transcript_33850:187-765(+)|eukprot:CAMPEP_0194304890 /NCGR_PEP_ID=MMETSP0171-20130528/2473_1 /TAXON_ID=218684 /ORGANISM="Corethron pennatum, Strain L29A3" /LENGTH=192 /DNA_ID=CAMNT_0039056261 /DNA_START=278 /DNA_END=856 /DNA_ORIENTATION=+
MEWDFTFPPISNLGGCISVSRLTPDPCHGSHVNRISSPDPKELLEGTAETGAKPTLKSSCSTLALPCIPETTPSVPPTALSLPRAPLAVRQYLSIHVYPTSRSKSVSVPGGLTYVVEAKDIEEKCFLKLANALSFAHYYGYSTREIESEDAYHQVHRRLHDGADGSNLYAIFSRDVTIFQEQNLAASTQTKC